MGLTGTGQEIGAGGGGSSECLMEYHIERPLSDFGVRINTYRKSHKFMTFGLASAVISGSGTYATDSWLTTYLAEIPWHIPAFYLNESEFNLLPNGSQCIEMTVQVIYRGSTIQFETGSTSSGLATLNQINDIAVANALNKTGWGSNVSFSSFNDSKPMIPTGISKPKYKAVAQKYRGMTNDYYGTNNDKSDFKSFIPHHQLGRQCFLYNYFAISTRTATKTGTVADPTSLYGGWPALAEKIQQIDGKTCVNQVINVSTYKPKMGQLKQPLLHYGIGLPYPKQGEAMTIDVGGNLVTPRVLNASYQKNNESGDLFSCSESVENVNNKNLSYDIYTPIEKSQISRSGFWSDNMPHIQPSLHIGVQPVPALTTTALLAEDGVFNQWTDTRAYWEVVATMKVKEYNPTHLPYATTANVPQGDVIMQHSNIPPYYSNASDEGATFQGLHKNSASTLTI